MRVDPTDRVAETLAPRWHTAALVGLIVAVAITGSVLTRPGATLPEPVETARGIEAYVPMLLVQWGLVAYVARVGRRRNALPSLLGTGWRRSHRAWTDVGLAIATWLALEGLMLAWARTFGTSSSPTTSALLPHTGQERLVWLVVAASAGFCEEVVYRGYLQTQLGAFSGSAGRGVALQAALFGIAHADQGPAAIPRIALCGLVLGVLARWRRSLWPGILCHAGIDVASALLR